MADRIRNQKGGTAALRKLRLGKETLRTLTAEQLSLPVGGSEEEHTRDCETGNTNSTTPAPPSAACISDGC